MAGSDKGCTLKIYWEDGITVELRDFPSIEEAQDYVERNDIWDFVIEEK